MNTVATEIAKTIIDENAHHEKGPRHVDEYDGRVSRLYLREEVDDRIVEIINKLSPKDFIVLITSNVDYNGDLLQGLWEIQDSDELLMKVATLNVHQTILDILESKV